LYHYTKGFVRRTIITVARQTLEFFVGSAVEDFVSSKLRALRTPATFAGLIDFVDVTMWPGGEWYQHAAPRPPPPAAAAATPAAAAAAAAAPEAAAKDEEEAVIMKVRDALLAAGSRGPLPGLLGGRNYTRGALDVLAAARSDLMTRQIGLLVLEAALEALFPELEGLDDSLPPPLVVADQGEADVDGGGEGGGTVGLGG
jgi:sorting nexin-13